MGCAQSVSSSQETTKRKNGNKSSKRKTVSETEQRRRSRRLSVKKPKMDKRASTATQDTGGTKNTRCLQKDFFHLKTEGEMIEEAKEQRIRQSSIRGGTGAAPNPLTIAPPIVLREPSFNATSLLEEEEEFQDRWSMAEETTLKDAAAHLGPSDSLPIA